MQKRMKMLNCQTGERKCFANKKKADNKLKTEKELKMRRMMMMMMMSSSVSEQGRKMHLFLEILL